MGSQQKKVGLFNCDATIKIKHFRRGAHSIGRTHVFYEGIRILRMVGQFKKGVADRGRDDLIARDNHLCSYKTGVSMSSFLADGLYFFKKMPRKPHEWPFKLQKRAFRAFKKQLLHGEKGEGKPRKLNLTPF